MVRARVIWATSIALWLGPAGLRAAEPGPSVDSRLAQLEQDVQALKARPAAPAAPAPEPQLHELQTRVDALRGAVEELAGQVAGAHVAADEEAGLRARLSALDRDVVTLRNAMSLPVSAPPTGGIGAGGGAGGQIVLRMNAFLQVEYLGTRSQHGREPSQSGLNLRRARLQWSGAAVSPRVQYVFSLELGGGRVAPYEAFLDLVPTPSWRLRVGQMKVPFSRTWLLPDNHLAFPERSLATEEFRYDRDIGAMLTGRILGDRLQLWLAGINGAGPATLGNDNLSLALVGRAAATFGGMVAEDQEGDWQRSARPSAMVGVGAVLDHVPAPGAYGYRFTNTAPVAARPLDASQRDPDGDGRVDDVQVLQVELDALVRWRGVELAGELYARRESWGRIGANTPPVLQARSRYVGGYLQATYTLDRPRLQLGGRVSYADVSPLTVDGRSRPTVTCQVAGGTPFACTLPYADRRGEVSVVLLWAPLGHSLKLSAMATYLRWSTTSALGASMPPADSDDYRALLQVQAGF